MEDVMLDVMFDLPDNKGSRYLIEARHVDEKQPILSSPEARPKSA
jgi:ATP-dependent protease Clp ATPase subunit